MADSERHAVADLLVACATTKTISDERLTDLLSGIRDWRMLLDGARRHGLVALAALHLSRVQSVSPDVRGLLRGMALEIGESSLVLTARLIEVSRLFSDAGIIAVPFKGPALAASVYDNVGLRHSLDLDLVVRRREAVAAKRLLEAHGFHGGPKSIDMVAAWVRHGRSITMQSADGLVVDLQWAADLSEKLNMDAMFDRLGSLDLGGEAVPTFCDEDLLLLLCVHGSKHLWSHLYWVTDVAELVARRPALAWGRLLSTASRARALRRLLVGLTLANRLRKLDLPSHVEAHMRADPQVDLLANELWAEMFDARGRRFPLSALHLRMRDGWKDAASFALRLAMTPTDDDWVWLPLPGKLWWLYPLLKPVRLGVKYGNLAVLPPRP